MDPYLDLLQRGGVALWLVLAALLAGMTFGLERLIALTRNKYAPKDFEKDVIHIADLKGMDAAVSLCRQNPNALGRVLSTALIRHGSPRAELEAAVREESHLLLRESQQNANACGWLGGGAVLIALAGMAVDTLQVSFRFQEELNTALSSETSSIVFGKGFILGLPAMTLALVTAAILFGLFALTRDRAKRLALEVEARAIDAVVTLDRRARQSIRLVEDLEEKIKTESMIKIPDLSAEFEDSQPVLESAVKTAVTTHAGMPAGSGILRAPETGSASSSSARVRIAQ